MTTLNINGHSVAVDDSFMSLSPDQQNDTVDEISKSLPAPPPEVSTGADIGKSAGTGLARGMLDFAGAAGTAREAASGALDWAGKTLGISPETIQSLKNAGYDVAQTNPAGAILSNAPSTRDLTGDVESVTGPLYSPQTTAGKFAGSAAEQLGNPATYLGPGRAFGKIAAGTAAGLAGEAGGELAGEPGRIAGSMAAGALTGHMVNAARFAATRTPPPTTQELFEAAKGQYQAMHGFGVELHPWVAEETATNIENELNSAGYRPLIAPKTYGIVSELRLPEGDSLPTQQIESIRRALGKVGYDPNERDAARRAIAGIDDMLDNLTPDQALINGHYASQVGEQARLARANYAGAKRSEQIENATSSAELQAASTGSGANIDNATRQKFRQILTSPSKSRGYSAADLSDMRALVQGSDWGDAARLLGKFSPTGAVSGMAAYGAAHALGIPAWAVGVGATAAKLASDQATKFKATRIAESQRLRTPLAKTMGSTPLPAPVPASSRIAGAATKYGLPAINPFANPANGQ